MPDYWTVDQLHALPDDGQRYEIIDGELHVTPAPSFPHQLVIGELVYVLKPWCDAQGYCLLFAPAAVTWSPRTEVQPDILVMPKVNGRPPGRFEDVGRLLLAIEVLAPSTKRWDRFTKRREYQRRGVPEYWIVDIEARCVERWPATAESPEVIRDIVSFRADEASAGLDVRMQDVFRAALGDAPAED
ncbi:MAG: Uma2 family endonuclease [Cytophagaceae bacterium]|nr:Uma2 family endonuclease [Gemmatimonadaceae bacterium]